MTNKLVTLKGSCPEPSLIPTQSHICVAAACSDLTKCFVIHVCTILALWTLIFFNIFCCYIYPIPRNPKKLSTSDNTFLCRDQLITNQQYQCLPNKGWVQKKEVNWEPSFFLGKLLWNHWKKTVKTIEEPWKQPVFLGEFVSLTSMNKTIKSRVNYQNLGSGASKTRAIILAHLFHCSLILRTSWPAGGGRCLDS